MPETNPKVWLIIITIIWGTETNELTVVELSNQHILKFPFSSVDHEQHPPSDDVKDDALIVYADVQYVPL